MFLDWMAVLDVYLGKTAFLSRYKSFWQLSHWLETIGGNIEITLGSYLSQSKNWASALLEKTLKTGIIYR